PPSHDVSLPLRDTIGQGPRGSVQPARPRFNLPSVTSRARRSLAARVGAAGRPLSPRLWGRPRDTHPAPSLLLRRGRGRLLRGRAGAGSKFHVPRPSCPPRPQSAQHDYHARPFQPWTAEESKKKPTNGSTSRRQHRVQNRIERRHLHQSMGPITRDSGALLARLGRLLGPRHVVVRLIPRAVGELGYRPKAGRRAAVCPSPPSSKRNCTFDGRVVGKKPSAWDSNTPRNLRLIQAFRIRAAQNPVQLRGIVPQLTSTWPR